MRIVLTGCIGFIGSHLAERLLTEGFEVFGIDAITNYYDPIIKQRNLDVLRKSSRFHFLEADLLDVDLANVLKDAELLFHLAAQPGVRSSWGQSFSRYVENNITATHRLLEYAKGATTLKKIVYASSSSVYGEPTREQVDEDHPTRPRSPYGVSKLAAEQLCETYRAGYEMPVVSLRLFTVYGPRQRPDMAFHRLISAGLNGEPFPLYGDGSQERDFTYVGDVVEGFVRAGISTAEAGIFNIGGGHVVSMNAVIAEVEGLLGRPIARQTLPFQRGDLQRTSADISKAKATLGFMPQVNLRSGLERQIAFMQAHKGA